MEPKKKKVFIHKTLTLGSKNDTQPHDPAISLFEPNFYFYA